jgi:hypothetical protein
MKDYYAIVSNGMYCLDCAYKGQIIGKLAEWEDDFSDGFTCSNCKQVFA